MSGLCKVRTTLTIKMQMILNNDATDYSAFAIQLSIQTCLKFALLILIGAINAIIV